MLPRTLSPAPPCQRSPPLWGGQGRGIKFEISLKIQIDGEPCLQLPSLKTFDKFLKDLGTLSTGRANSNMLDLISVDVYGQKMPINQLASITTPEPRVINIQVWDNSNVTLIDSAIQKSNLGLNPQIDGQMIRLPIPVSYTHLTLPTNREV